jgi:nucleoside-diphosphate-sugar epimerase
MGENMCASWFHEYGVPAKSVRIYHAYGPTLDIINDKRVFSEFVANIVQKESIVMKSDGSPVRSFCYISDATVAFFLVLLNGNNGESYNVANPDCMVSMRDLAQTLVSIRPELNLKLIESVRPNDNNYIENKRPNRITADITKIKRLGWNPKVPISEGFRRTIDSFINE